MLEKLQDGKLMIIESKELNLTYHIRLIKGEKYWILKNGFVDLYTKDFDDVKEKLRCILNVTGKEVDITIKD